MMASGELIDTEQPGQPTQPRGIKALLSSEDFRKRMGEAMPKHMKPERLARVAVGALQRAPKLAQCTEASFFECMLKLSAWGLEPDGRAAHLIPFENKKKRITECQLIVDYKGIAELVYRTGLVSSIHADVVCANDIFDANLGEVTTHKINYKEQRGDWYAAYCIVRFKDGGHKTEVMSRPDIEAIRDKSQGYRSAIQYGSSHPWIDYPHEMAKKTVFKRLSKWVPWSAEIRDAMDTDNDAEDLQVMIEAEVAKRQRLTIDDYTTRAAIDHAPQITPEHDPPPPYSEALAADWLGAAKTLEELDAAANALDALEGADRAAIGGMYDQAKAKLK